MCGAFVIFVFLPTPPLNKNSQATPLSPFSKINVDPTVILPLNGGESTRYRVAAPALHLRFIVFILPLFTRCDSLCLRLLALFPFPPASSPACTRHFGEEQSYGNCLQIFRAVEQRGDWRPTMPERIKRAALVAGETRGFTLTADMCQQVGSYFCAASA